MTLFFSLENLQKESKGDSRKFISLLKDQENRVKYRKSLSGNSFILNPKPLLNNTDTDIYYIVQYIKLAGRRDYLLYKTNNVITLDTSYYPELNYSAIKTNPLLTLNKKQIHFKYEEIYNVYQIWRNQRKSS